MSMKIDLIHINFICKNSTFPLKCVNRGLLVLGKMTYSTLYEYWLLKDPNHNTTNIGRFWKELRKLKIAWQLHRTKNGNEILTWPLGGKYFIQNLLWVELLVKCIKNKEPPGLARWLSRQRHLPPVLMIWVWFLSPAQCLHDGKEGTNSCGLSSDLHMCARKPTEAHKCSF